MDQLYHDKLSFRRPDVIFIVTCGHLKGEDVDRVSFIVFFLKLPQFERRQRGDQTCYVGCVIQLQFRVFSMIWTSVGAIEG